MSGPTTSSRSAVLMASIIAAGTPKWSTRFQAAPTAAPTERPSRSSTGHPSSGSGASSSGSSSRSYQPPRRLIGLRSPSWNNRTRPSMAPVEISALRSRAPAPPGDTSPAARARPRQRPTCWTPGRSAPSPWYVRAPRGPRRPGRRGPPRVARRVTVSGSGAARATRWPAGTRGPGAGRCPPRRAGRTAAATAAGRRSRTRRAPPAWAARSR